MSLEEELKSLQSTYNVYNGTFGMNWTMDRFPYSLDYLERQMALLRAKISMKVSAEINIDDVIFPLRYDKEEALRVIKKIDLSIADKDFSAEYLLWLFNDLNKDIPKDQLLKYLETGSEAAIKDW